MKYSDELICAEGGVDTYDYKSAAWEEMPFTVQVEQTHCSYFGVQILRPRGQHATKLQIQWSLSGTKFQLGTDNK